MLILLFSEMSSFQTVFLFRLYFYFFLLFQWWINIKDYNLNKEKSHLSINSENARKIAEAAVKNIEK